MSATELWAIDEDAFPREGDAAAQLAFAARCAVLAPSSHNTQPWQFFIHGDRLDLHADRGRALGVIDPHDRELIISCGAALFYLRLALRRFGRASRVELLPNTVRGDVVASVWLEGACTPTAADERLFAAIPRRHTNRAPFVPEAVAEAVRLALVDAARSEDAWLYLAGGLAKEALATLIGDADRRQMADAAFRHELAAWLRPNDADVGDGIPGYARARGDLSARIEPFVVRRFDVGGGQAARDHELAVGSPLLAVLGTAGDDERDWMIAGQALACVLLEATAAGLAASFLNQPVEVLDFRGRVSEVIGKSAYPQLLLRLGRPTATATPTPRRPLSDVIRVTE
jgi:nitroreductase